MPKKPIDITGQKFGRLTAIRYSGGEKWLCDCDCGNQSLVRGSHLRSGQTQSCGGKGRSCIRRELADLSGVVFGNLTVIRHNGYHQASTQRVRRFDCRCACGKIINVRACNLRRGVTDNCGCVTHARRVKSSTRHGKSKTAEYRLLYGAKGRSKKGGHKCDLTLADIIIPTNCPLLGIPLKATGMAICANSPTLDKLVPELGYTRGNVWVISQKANRMKSDLTPDQMRHFLTVIESRILAITR